MTQGTMTTITASDGFNTDAYFVSADNPGKAGVICVMEAFGLNSPIKKVADDYAANGFSVVAPSLYDRQGRQQCFDYYTELPAAVDAMNANGFDNPLFDVAGCIALLQQQGVERIGIVGYCYGGTVSWLAASRNTGIAAAACYYGSAILAFPDDHPRCPTIAHWGKSDPTTPAEKVAVVESANPSVASYWYEAGHGFNSRERKDSYDAAAADQASQRTLTFFRQQLC